MKVLLAFVYFFWFHTCHLWAALAHHLGCAFGPNITVRG